jgi:solute carrier family 25 (mitochondrial uncoupling protein), member 27
MANSPNPKSPPHHDLFARVGLTIISAACSETVTYPIDMVKTRLQLQGEMQTKAATAVRKSAIQMFRHITATEGVAGLYRGWLPAIVRHFPYSGFRIVVYEDLRNLFGANKGNALSIPLQFVIGFTSGAVGQIIAVPMDLIKVRMQADGRLVAAGLMDKPRYSGLSHALRTIIKEEGFFGMWAGTTPAVFRAAMVNLGELASYDISKRQILKTGLVDDNIYAHTFSGFASGFFATVASTPADVVKTRMMNQGKPEKDGFVKYKGPIDCLVKTAKTEGIMALYKGFFPTWARLGPWQLVFWVTYEKLRKLSGKSSF